MIILLNRKLAAALLEQHNPRKWSNDAALALIDAYEHLERDLGEDLVFDARLLDETHLVFASKADACAAGHPVNADTVYLPDGRVIVQTGVYPIPPVP